MIYESNQKEIFECCAKAIGRDLTNWEYSYGSGFYLYGKNGTDYWNPLEYADDLIYIITKLNLSIHTYDDEVVVESTTHSFLTSVLHKDCADMYSNGAPEALAIAVIMVAAGIGGWDG